MISPTSVDELELDKIQMRLAGLWSHINSNTPREHTSVVVPSLSFDSEELAKITGVSFYEERLLFTLIRLRHPLARVVYITSQPLHPDIIDYYLQLLVGVPATHARRRLMVLCLYDASAVPLTRKILDRPRFVERVRRLLGDPQWAYLTCFNSTPLEEELALRLGIPLNAARSRLLRCGTKSGSREIFVTAGVAHPLGANDIRTEDGLVEAVLRLARQRPALRRTVVKLNESFAGEGNAVLTIPYPVPTDDEAARNSVRESLATLQWSAAAESYPRYLRKLGEMGCVVEEFIEGDPFRSPSVQLRTTPLGEVEIISTHDQVLGGPVGQEYLGCRFPASGEYREMIQREALKIGEVLRDKGVVSRFGVDFVAVKDGTGAWSCFAIEINLRMGGTTHPFLALQFLTGGELDRSSGLFVSPRGTPKYYFSTDSLKSPAYRGLLPDDLVEVLALHGLNFLPSTETGVLFHMIGPISQYGKVGVTCIGDSRDEADALYQWTTRVLDQETGASPERQGRLERLFDRPGMEWRLPGME